MTARGRIWARTSEPFSTTTTDMSDESCLSLMAAASPAGPAPTITTSSSIASRSGNASPFISSSLLQVTGNLHEMRAVASESMKVYQLREKAYRKAMTDGHQQALRALLAFYQEAGVDDLIGEDPIDRLTQVQAPRAASLQRIVASGPAPRNASFGLSSPPRNAAPAPSPRSAPPISPETAAMPAPEARRGAGSFEELRKFLLGFEGWVLGATATQLVFADGNPEARVMFVGEAPGRDEDIVGLPFVGRSGKLLDRMLAAIGLDRQSAYIA